MTPGLLRGRAERDSLSFMPEARPRPPAAARGHGG